MGRNKSGLKHSIDAISELRAFSSRSGGLQAKLPKIMKKNSGTRPWRSYHDVHKSDEQ